jgi:hypothetical protein
MPNGCREPDKHVKDGNRPGSDVRASRQLRAPLPRHAAFRFAAMSEFGKLIVKAKDSVVIAAEAVR